MTDWQIYTNTQEIWKEMLSDIENAKESIEMEQYSFWDDEAGHKFLEALRRKNSEGVKVRILCDGYGSYPLFKSIFVAKIISEGVEIEKFNPPNLLRPTSLFYHMHKKTLVIDSRIGWIGGIGIKNKFTFFRDSMARLTGMIVDDLRTSFELLWADCKKRNYFNNPSFEKLSRDFELHINYSGYGRKEIYEQMRKHIKEAKKCVYLTTSYFFPDRNFFQLLLDKAKEGLEIKMILRGKDDEYLPVRFSTSYFYKSLAANIQIFRFEPEIMHAKTVIIDDWATLGSSNLDKFSFYYNLEANIVSSEPGFVEVLKNQFRENLKLSRQIVLSDWQRRPVFERVIELLTWPIHNYL